MGDPTVSCRNLWKVYGPRPERVVGSAEADLPRAELLERTGCVVAVRDVSFDVAPGEEAQVTARITPTSDALAGDYVVTFRASTQEANASEDIRVTIETSLTWALVGIALIVATLAGLGWVFSRYGRR